MTPTELSVIHFNDVYRVRPQKVSPASSETIDVTQFCALLDSIREQWPLTVDGKRDGLVLFSGDVFSPSVESSVTRGSHMVPVMNEIGPDIALTGYPHLCKLVQATSFPWLLSNIIDNETSRAPEYLQEFVVIERAGIRIGVIGLVEKEWIGTVSSWPTNFEYRDMSEVGKNLSRRLRDPQGAYKCDFIIALTHSRVPNDIDLARDLLALSPSAQAKAPIASSHGVDIILGGHDHLYYISRGVDSWQDYDTTQNVLGAEEDHGDVLVVKSGTDFRELSELTIELVDTPQASIRRKIIKKITGRRHTTTPGSKSCARLAGILSPLLSSVSTTMKSPVCKAAAPIDTRSQLIRTAESAAGNWFADVVRHAYDDALYMRGCGGSDGTFICAGMIRGDSIYGPGNITLGDILEILPFEDPLVVLELDGEAIWAALEAALQTWPAQEGRFPVVSGFRVSWDSRRPPGERVLGVWLQSDKNCQHEGTARNTRPPIHEEEIKRAKSGRRYKIVTREYMAQGHDGYLPLQGQKYLIDEESGQMMSTIVRKYLMGSQFINNMIRTDNSRDSQHLDSDTRRIILQEKAQKEYFESEAKSKATHNWKELASLAVHRSRSRRHYKDQLSVSSREHMSHVDCFDGKAMRGQEIQNHNTGDDSHDDLLIIHPEIDGRLKDVGE